MDTIPFFSFSLLLLLLLSSACCCSAATITLSNRCSYTVWPGILSNAGWPMLANGGFELPAGESASLSAPPGWSGRFWGRTSCKFGTGAATACATGDCAGRLQCAGTGATTPATLAEISVGIDGSKDFYDVSLVDGYNLPLAVVPTGGSAACESAICAANINLVCPTALQVLDMVGEGSGGASSAGRGTASAAVVGCRSACDAFRSPQFCCSGAYASPATCSPSTYAHLFKSACPSAYSYAFDDPTSTFTCSSADYTIVFCPSSNSQKTVRGIEQPDLVGTQAYASEASTSTKVVYSPPLLFVLIVHVTVHCFLQIKDNY